MSQPRNRKDPRRTPLGIAALCAVAALGIGSARGAGAASCAERVEALAKAHAIPLETERRTTRPGDPSPSPEQQRPGPGGEESLPPSGVIRPPPAASPGVIEPPEGGPGGMPTTPNVEEPAPDQPTGPHGLDAAERLRLEAILGAARAEAEGGDAEDCFRRLKEAENLVRSASRPER